MRQFLLRGCKQSAYPDACYSTPYECFDVEEPRGFGTEDDCAKAPAQCNAQHPYADNLTITHTNILSRPKKKSIGFINQEWSDFLLTKELLGDLPRELLLCSSGSLQMIYQIHV